MLGLVSTPSPPMVRQSVDTVRRWNRRGQGISARSMTMRVAGRPLVYPQEIRLRMVAFYCQTQPLPECGRWTFPDGASHIRPTGGLVPWSAQLPSKSTLHRILQSNLAIKPHQSSYSFISPIPTSFPRCEHLVGLYRNPPQNLIFFDECPGI